jgi:hypothetical protein
MFFTGFIIGKKKEYDKGWKDCRDYFMENYEVTLIDDILEDLSKEYEKKFNTHSQ